MTTFDAKTRVRKVRDRLAASASKWLRCTKLSIPDRAAMQLLIEAGEVEIFPSPSGRGNAYRFVVKP